MKRRIAQDNAFICGILYSAATLIMIYNEGAAEQLINESGLEWKDLKKAKVDPFDRKILRKIKHRFRDEK
jgi:hypothetical protein